MASDFSYKEILVDFLTKSLPLFTVSLILFVGGVALLALNIPGWSLILGLPSVQIGIVLLIFTYEAIGQRKSTLSAQEYHLISCLICHRPSLSPKFIQKTICQDCQVKIAQNIKNAIVVVYVLITIPLTVGLLKENLDLRNQARQATSYCQAGVWSPPVCSCGQWQKDICPEGGRARQCQNDLFCCFPKEDNVWQCQPLVK
jgi:hypothetical protein